MLHKGETQCPEQQRWLGTVLNNTGSINPPEPTTSLDISPQEKKNVHQNTLLKVCPEPWPHKPGIGRRMKPPPGYRGRKGGGPAPCVDVFILFHHLVSPQALHIFKCLWATQASVSCGKPTRAIPSHLHQQALVRKAFLPTDKKKEISSPKTAKSTKEN